MDPIRTLLLARTHTVVLDPDRVASAATRPTRDVDVDKFEDELLQLGFVMSLDLAMAIRRLPHQTLQELRNWIVDTLAKTLGAHRPHVPLFRGFPATVPGDTKALYARRVMTWLLTSPEHPCPWCSEVKSVGALDPCGHLVCRTCWSGGNYAGCPICHRRIAVGDPFLRAPAGTTERATAHAAHLHIVHLAFDVLGVARQRFERLLARTTPLGKDDRAELEAVIDAIGPRVATWLPARIPMRETMAMAIGRVLLVAPDRVAMLHATQHHLGTATDVLRVAAVLMKADPSLAAPAAGTAKQLGSIGRPLRRALLAALDRLEPALAIEDMRRHVGLWKRVGERLHPFELAHAFPRAALAFAAIRETDLTALPALGAVAAEQAVTVIGDRVRMPSFAGPVEDALRQGDARTAAAKLAARPGELLRRVDHLLRVTEARQRDAIGDVLDAIRKAIPRGAPATLLALAAHVAKRDAPWPRRVFFPKGDVLNAWGTADTRAPLGADAIGAVIAAVRTELMARAASSRLYARAVIDRRLESLPVPFGERSASKTKIAWPRGSEIVIPHGDVLRLFLHWEQPRSLEVDLDLSVAFYDAQWRQVGKCDYTNLRLGDTAAIHSGDLTSAPEPLGASEFVDLDLQPLIALGARHAVMVVFGYNNVAFDRLTHGFAGLMVRPASGQAFDPRAVAQRFDLHGQSVVAIPLTIDLEAHRLRWIDVHVKSRGELHSLGNYRAALAHVGRDFADLIESGARPTLWDLACVHATARANVVYVREGNGEITLYRRRDGESIVARLGRLYTSEHDGVYAAIPSVQAPTWFAVERDDLAIPQGSAGFILDARKVGPAFTRVDAADLVAELAPRPPRG